MGVTTLMNLDDRTAIEAIDQATMRTLLAQFADQLADAKRLGDAFRIDPIAHYRSARHILFSGLGGSAIGADVIRSCVEDVATVPILVNRDYHLPRYIGSESLVIISSYSGNTEETIAAFEVALERKAHILAVTSGGKVAAMASGAGIPHVPIPEGFPPRCALGYAVIPMLVLLGKWGFIPDRQADIDETLTLIRKLERESCGLPVPTAHNQAK